MKFSGHLAASLPLGLALGWAGGSWPAGAAALLAGVLIDADHAFDYTVNNGRFESLGHMFRFCYGYNLRRVYLLGHSYELWLLGLVFLPRLLPPPVGWGLLAGWLSHLLLDQIFNSVKPGGYFLLYRLAQRFRAEAILGQPPPERRQYVQAGRPGGGS